MKAFLFYISFIFLIEKSYEAQSYDSYVLALQWSNGVCQVNSCSSGKKRIEKNTLSIHGLWPTLKSGKQLNPCTEGETVKKDSSDIVKKMEKLWPSILVKNTDEAFWEHEYNKHGYCHVVQKKRSGWKDYFKDGMDLFDKENYKTLMQNAFPNSDGQTVKITYNELKKKFQQFLPGIDFKMNCKGGYITEFYFYYDINFKRTDEVTHASSCDYGAIKFK